ncbi:hypothetical protein KDK_59900 [Dictyobacter kobayashii]|uniref:Uncharacterized protein n=1 Tax=Dictyobacter kobayashii TaxID=2014872 RepID=A0A402ASU9_9CHLR|nr:hypothetical protein KDK_59900 [Dictyobacter kobayashii]
MFSGIAPYCMLSQLWPKAMSRGAPDHGTYIGQALQVTQAHQLQPCIAIGGRLIITVQFLS